MKIGFPVAAYHPGNPADYLAAAARRAGHEAEILALPQFRKRYLEADYDLFIGVDSSQSFDLREEFPGSEDLSRLAFWSIDFRHNKSRRERVPNDWELVRLLSERGAAIFQAQTADAEECRNDGIERCWWVPLGADAEVWSDAPAEEKRFDLGFVGNVYEQSRARVLESLLKDERFRFAFGGPHQGKPGLWKEQAAKFLRMCRVGFNVNSFYGSEYDYDLNMRLFETLSCGIPLITNYVPSLAALFGGAPPFIRTYDSLESLHETVAQAMEDESFLQSGAQAREYVLQNATYDHRLQQMLELTGSMKEVQQ